MAEEIVSQETEKPEEQGVYGLINAADTLPQLKIPQEQAINELEPSVDQLDETKPTPVKIQLPKHLFDTKAQLAELALPTLDKDMIRFSIENENEQEIQRQAAGELQTRKLEALALEADQAATAGDPIKLSQVLVDASKTRKLGEPLDGSVPKLAVENLSLDNQKDMPTEPSYQNVLSDRAAKRQLFRQALAEVEARWQQQSTLEKGVELVPFFVPWVSQWYQADDLGISKLQAFNPLFGEVSAKKINEIQNRPYHEVVDFVNNLKQNILASDAPGGALLNGRWVLNRLLEGTTSDRNMENVFSLIDAAPAAVGVGKLTATATRALKVKTMSIIESTKELSGSKVASEEIGKFWDGVPTNKVDSSDAAMVNTSHYKEPFKEVDAGIAQRLNNKFIAEDNAFGILEQYKNNPIALRAREIIENHRGIDLTAEELEIAKKEASTLFAEQFSLRTVPEVATNVNKRGDLVHQLTFGSPDGTGFVTEKQAIKYMTDNFDVSNEWRVVKDTDGTFRLQVDSEIQADRILRPIEIRHEPVAERILAGLGMRNPRGAVREETVSSALASVTTESQLQKLFAETVARTTKGIGNDDLRAISKVLEKQRAEERWFTNDELIDMWPDVVGRDITQRELRAFDDFRLLEDIDYTISNINVRDYLSSLNARTFKAKSSVARYEDFIGKEIKDFDSLPTDRIYNIDTKRFETVTSAKDFDNLVSRGNRIIRSYDNYKVNGEDVFYVMAKSATDEALPSVVLPYKPGGRIQYQGDFLVKQAKLVKTIKDGKPRDVLMGFRTTSIDSVRTRREANQLVRNFNKGLDHLEASKKAASVDEIARLRKLADDSFQLTKYKSLRNVESLMKKGKLSNTKMQLVTDRQTPFIERSLFADGNRLDDSVDHFFNNMRRGELKENATGAPAELLSPFEAQAKVFTKDATSFAYRQFTLNNAKRFEETFGKYLIGDYSSAMDMVKTGKFAPGAPTDIVTTGTMYQNYIRNTARVTEKIDRSQTRLVEALTWIDNNLPRDVAQIAAGTRIALHNAKPFQYARTTAYMLIFGFYNPVQFVVQSTSVLNAFAYKAANPRLASLAMKDFGAMTLALGARKVNGVRSAADVAAFSKLIRRTDKEMADKLPQLLKDWDDVGLNIVDFNFAYLDNQAAALTKASAAERSTVLGRTAGQAQRIASEQLQKSTVFATTGEVAGRLAAFTIGRRTLLESPKYAKYAGKVNQMPAEIRKQFIKELRNQTDRLSTGQTRATQLGIQNLRHQSGLVGGAGEVIALMTQFWQFPIKLLSSMLPKAVGGSAAFTAKEKIALAVAGAFVIGPEHLPGGDVIQTQMYSKFVEAGLYTGTLEEWRRDTAGMLDRLLTTVTGEQVDFGSRVGVGAFPSQVAQMVFGEGQNFWVSAAFPSVARRVFNNMTLYNRLENMRNGNEAYSITPAIVAAWKAMVYHGTSTGSGIKRVLDAIDEVPVASTVGTPLFKQSPKSAWLNLLGIPTAEYTNYFRSQEVLQAWGQSDAGAVRTVRYGLREWYRAQNKGDQEAMMNWAIAIDTYKHVNLKGDPARINRVFNDAFDGLNLPEAEKMKGQFRDAIIDKELFKQRQEFLGE